MGATAPQWARASSFTRFLAHTQRRTTVGRTPLDELSVRHRDLYLTTHNIHNRQTSMPPVGFEHTISAGERPQTYALDRAATWTGKCATYTYTYIYIYSFLHTVSTPIYFHESASSLGSLICLNTLKLYKSLCLETQ